LGKPGEILETSHPEVGDKVPTVVKDSSVSETGEGRTLQNRIALVKLIFRLLNQMVALGETARQLRPFLCDEYNPSGTFKVAVKETGE
jgi:hypothetical protein